MSGKLFVITAPSGAGKSSLINALLKDDPTLKLSISYTTRAPRPGEQDGREFHFVDRPTFLAMRGRGEFLESAEVHGNHYGTSKKVIEQSLARGEDVLLEIDWQGAQQVRRLYPGCVGIFKLYRTIRRAGNHADFLPMQQVRGRFNHIDFESGTPELQVQSAIRVAFQ